MQPNKLLCLTALLIVSGCNRPAYTSAHSNPVTGDPRYEETQSADHALIGCNKKPSDGATILIGEWELHHKPLHQKIQSSERKDVRGLASASNACIVQAIRSYEDIFGGPPPAQAESTPLATGFAADISSAIRVEQNLKAYSQGKLSRSGFRTRMFLLPSLDDETGAIYADIWKSRILGAAESDALVKAKAAMAYAEAYDPEKEKMKQEIEELKVKADEHQQDLWDDDDEQQAKRLGQTQNSHW